MPSIDDNATGVKDAGKQQVRSHEGDLDGRLFFSHSNSWFILVSSLKRMKGIYTP